MATSNPISQFSKAYTRIFALEELAQSVRLKSLFIISWLLCIVDLNRVSENPGSGAHTSPLCWPYWSQCMDSYRFDSFPESYHYTLWMACIFAFLLAALWFFLYKKWNRAHFFLTLVILWKLALNFIFVDYHHTDLELLHLLPSLVLLFSRNKLQSLRYLWSLLCLFIVRAKMNEGWILGSVFSSLSAGFPLVADSFVPVLTNATIVLEIICAVGLLSQNRRWKEFSFWFWLVVGVGSVSTLGFRYALHFVSFHWLLFGFPQWQSSAEVPHRSRGFIGWRTTILVAVVAVTSFTPFLISEDVFSTFEGVDYGFFLMAENDQCIHFLESTDSHGQKIRSWQVGSLSFSGRCLPQDLLQGLQQSCKTGNPQKRIAWKFWESRNGEPFYELINEADACSLQYKPFSHNTWIHLPKDSPVRGYPQKNSFLATSEQAPKVLPAAAIAAPNSILLRLYPWLKKFYVLLWSGSFLYFLLCFFGIEIKIFPLRKKE